MVLKKSYNCYSLNNNIVRRTPWPSRSAPVFFMEVWFMSKNNCNSSRSNRSEKDQKKIMVSRRFLQMPSELQELIQRKSENLENLNSMACRMTSQISRAPSHSGDPHAREAIIAKKMDLEKEIAGYREKLEAVRAEGRAKSRRQKSRNLIILNI